MYHTASEAAYNKALGQPQHCVNFGTSTEGILPVKDTIFVYAILGATMHIVAVTTLS
jgi:hypothetical protein